MNKCLIVTNVLITHIFRDKKMSGKWEISLKCNETLPSEEKLDKAEEKKPDKQCEERECRKNLYKCDKCGQHVHQECVMCPARDYTWRDDDPDDRYTEFWNSPSGDEAVKNAHSWSWDKYKEYNGKEAEEERRILWN